MGRADYLRLGDWDSICDVCGQKYKASKLKKRWDGLMVCPKDYEERHPQDFVRGIRDDQSTPFSRPEPPDSFVPINYTQYPAEPLSLFESVSKTFFKEYNSPNARSDGIIGGAALGVLAIGTSTARTPTSDDLALSESISITAGKNVAESLSITEVTTFTLITQTVLGGSAIGSHALGA